MSINRFCAILLSLSALCLCRARAGEVEPVLSTCPKPHLAMLYAEPDFKGQPVPFGEEGRVLSNIEFVSFRLAPGFRLRMWPGSTKEGEECWIFGEDARDVKLLDLPGKIRSLRIERRPVVPRPRVYMAAFGTNELLRDENDATWHYVQTHVDGIWEHCPWSQESRDLIRKVKTRNRIRENAFSWHNPDEKKWAPWPRMMESEQADLEREGVALHRGFTWYNGSGPYTSKDWVPEDVKIARAEYAQNPKIPSGRAFRDVYVGILNGIWEPDKHPPGLEAAFDEADGIWVEGGRVSLYPKTIWLDAIQRAHRKPEGKLVWSGSGLDRASYESDIERFKCAYYGLEAQRLLKPHDIIMLINYHGQIPTHPEIDPATGRTASTYTGVLSWLLRQGLPDRKTTLQFAKEYLKSNDTTSAWVVLDRMVRYVAEGHGPYTSDDRQRLMSAHPQLQSAGAQVKRKDYAAARGTLESAIRSLEGAASSENGTQVVSAKPKVRFDQKALAQWVERLHLHVKERVDKGARPQFSARLMGDTPSTLKILKMGDQDLTVELSGGQLPVPWTELKTEAHLSLAQACFSEEDARSRVFLGVFLCAAGRIESGESRLAEALLADSSVEPWVKEARAALRPEGEKSAH